MAEWGHLSADELGCALSFGTIGAASSLSAAPAGKAKAKGKGKEGGKPKAASAPKPKPKPKGKATAEAPVKHVEPTGPLVGDANFPADQLDGKYYITTAISYTNGYPHMGHAYEALSTDVIARWHRMWGRKTFFLTGTDEHGQKIANTAAKDGLKPIDICDKYAGEFQKLNKRMHVTNDDFLRTTQERHHIVAQELWRRCAANGDIYLDNYTGWYLEREEMFVKPTEAEEWEFKDPLSGVPLKKVAEPSYFFRLSKYADMIIKLLEDHPEFCQPEDRRKVIMDMVKEGLEDLSISRTAFSWGIPVPQGFDQSHVMYVWFDALSNYVSGVYGTDPDHERAPYWPADCHIIGKDIIRFHCIYWPAMLTSAGLPLPKSVFSHGFIAAADGRKMSKSFNNVIDPHDMLDKYPTDTFRYYLCGEAPYGGELKFSEASLIRLHNGPLADTLGNLVHRATNMTSKYCGGSIPAASAAAVTQGLGFPIDPSAIKAKADEMMRVYDLLGATQLLMEASRDCNNWLQVKEPWKMKNRDEERVEVVRISLESVYYLAHLFAAFLPVACTEIFSRLGCPPQPLAKLAAGYSNLTIGASVTIGAPLFPKLDEALAVEPNADPAPAAAPAPGTSGAAAGGKGGKGKGGGGKGGGKGGGGGGDEEETTNEFAKLDIRVGELVDVWEHPNSDKLWCEKISCGDAEPREVASGLRAFFTKEQMLGQRVLVVCNLKPAKMGGFTSNGMVLCAKAGGAVEFVEPPAGASPGDRVLPEGITGGTTPLSANQVKKKKTWEAVEAGLRTAPDSPVALFDGKPLMVRGEVCAAKTLSGGATIN